MKRKRSILRRLAVSLIVVAALIFIADLIAPILLRDYVNKVLNESPGYRGRVDAITCHFWRGAYTLHRIDISKTSGNVPVPLYSSEAVDLSVEWRALWNGALVGEVEMEKPVINFVGGSTDAATQTGEDRDWTKVVRALFPLKINRLAVRDGQVHYRAFNTDPKVDIYLKDVEGEVTNLTNSLKLSKSLAAAVNVTARGEKSGNLLVKANIDPYADKATFSLNSSLTKLNITELNDFFLAYANIDIKHGVVDVYSDLDVRKGQVSGYVKPLAREIEFLDLAKDSEDPLHLVWQSAVAFVAEIFTNQSKDQLASKIPIRGSIDSPETKSLRAFVSLFKNAFIEALKPGVDSQDNSGATGDSKRSVHD